MAKYKLEEKDSLGKWNEGSDPREAYFQLLEHGVDPDDEYYVARTEQGLLSEVVDHGDLQKCLERASELSNEGYFVVFKATDLPKMTRVEVH